MLFSIMVTKNGALILKIKEMFSPFHLYCWKVVKHTLKILQCEPRKGKVCLEIFQYYARKDQREEGKK